MDKLRKVPRTSVEKVISILLERIREGEYRSGDKIIAHELAKDLGLSRAPVREAIHILAGQGVLELPPRRSARVRRLSADDIQHISELLKSIGGLVVRLAGQRISIADNADRVRAAMEAIRAAEKTGDPLMLLKAIDAYICELEIIAENPYLRRARESMHFEHLHRTMIEESSLWFEHVDVFVDDMQNITNSLLEGDFKKAELLYCQHVAWVLPILRSRLKENAEEASWYGGGS